jgi:hypothetical protein
VILKETIFTEKKPEKKNEEAAEGTADPSAEQLYCILRCNRWGQYERWRANAGVREQKPAEVNSWWGPMIIDGNVEQLGVVHSSDTCPVDIEEALETRLCVSHLPPHLKVTVWREHVTAGRQHQKAHALGIATRTFRHRLATAYPLLLGLFLDAAAGVLPK